MPSFSQNLENALHRALEYANERDHEYATLEHLRLLGLMDAVIGGCPTLLLSQLQMPVLQRDEGPSVGAVLSIRHPQLMSVPLREQARMHGTVVALVQALEADGFGPVRILCHDTRDLAFASSLDQIGPITKDVADAAFLLGVIAGHDPMDSTSADVPVPDYMKALKKKDLKKLKVGIPAEFFAEGLDPEVEQAVRAAIEELKSLGGEIKEIQLPRTDAAVAVYYVIATAEASSNLARFDGVKFGLRSKDTKDLLDLYTKTRQEGFGPEVKRRIMLGTYALSSGYYEAYYGKAQVVRTLIRQDFDAAFKEVDLIVTPVTPTPAFKLGEKSEDPLQMYLSDIFTISVNLAGLPAIALPCGFSKAGLPIGLQLIGRAFQEDTLLRAAHAYEQATQWRTKKPAIR